MKGPSERLKYDFRRVWECPRCGAKQRTDGTVTTQFCVCGKPNTNVPVAMKLVGDGARRTVPPIAPRVQVAAVEAISDAEPTEAESESQPADEIAPSVDPTDPAP